MNSKEEEREETESLESILSDIRKLGVQTPKEEEQEVRQEKVAKEEADPEEEGEDGQVTYTMKDNVKGFLMFYGIMALVVNGIILFAWAKAENEGGGANGNMVSYIVIGANALILLHLAFRWDWSTDEIDEDREPGILDRLSFLYHCGRYLAGVLTMGGTGILGMFATFHFSEQHLGGAALIGAMSVLPLVLGWFCARRGLQVYGAGLAGFRELDYVKNHRRSRGGHYGGGGDGGCGGGCGGCGGGE